MTDSPSPKTGLILITALGAATAVFLALITRELFFNKPDAGPETGRRTESSTALRRPDVAGEETAGQAMPDPPGTEWPLRLPTKPETPLPSSISNPDALSVQLNNEALAHYSQGEYSEAVDLFQKAYERDPRNPAVRNNLAFAKGNLAWKQVEARQYQDALLNYQSAILLKPDEPSFFAGQGLAYYRLNEGDRAVETLKRAVELDPNHPDVYIIIGDIYYQRDEIEMAAGYYEKGLELDPANEPLRRQLAKTRREEKVETGFQRQASRAFTVKFEGREEQKAARQVLEDLEEAYREIGQAMSFYPPDPVTVILYTGQQFQDVTRSASWTKGIYDGKIRIPIGGAERNPELLRRVLFHEYTHAVVHGLSNGLNVPTWLNEGLAVYFETGGRSSREGLLFRQLRSGTPLVPLARLHGSFMGLSDAQASLAYAESEAAVRALVDRYDLYRVRQLLEDLGNRKTFPAAFADQFMVPYETFQSEWQKTLQEAGR
ncbi:MAG: tetratricopeptide repeat protein [Nitrospirae bacterium]|nr:tetratricopeptide repeat protein [Nitrospirota bacterium]